MYPLPLEALLGPAGAFTFRTLNPLTGPPIPTPAAGRPLSGGVALLLFIAGAAGISVLGDIRSRALDGTPSVVLERSTPETGGPSVFVSDIHISKGH
jgi:hypothetical protein